MISPYQGAALLLALSLAFSLFVPALAAADTPAAEEVHSFSHWIPIGPGQKLFVTEYFTQSRFCASRRGR